MGPAQRQLPISTWPHFGPKLSSYLRVPPSGSMGFWFHNKIDVTSNSTAFVSSIIFILCRAKGATLHSILYTSFWGYLEKAHLVPPKYKPPGSLIIIIHIHPQMHFETNETTPQEKKNMEKKSETREYSLMPWQCLGPYT